MDDNDQLICDLSDLIANEVEIETSNSPNITPNSSKSTPKISGPFFEPADYSNGALYDASNYCWSQTFTEIG